MFCRLVFFNKHSADLFADTFLHSKMACDKLADSLPSPIYAIICTFNVFVVQNNRFVYSLLLA